MNRKGSGQKRSGKIEVIFKHLPGRVGKTTNNLSVVGVGRDRNKNLLNMSVGR
jgi:hypothetical protein